MAEFAKAMRAGWREVLARLAWQLRRLVAFPMPGDCRYLDVSTCHITQSDASLMGRVVVDHRNPDRMLHAHGFPIRVSPHQHGYIVFVPAGPDCGGEALDASNFRDSGFSDAFFGLMVFAQRLGFGVINLDADGTVIETLPTFEW